MALPHADRAVGVGAVEQVDAALLQRFARGCSGSNGSNGSSGSSGGVTSDHLQRRNPTRTVSLPVRSPGAQQLAPPLQRAPTCMPIAAQQVVQGRATGTKGRGGGGLAVLQIEHNDLQGRGEDQATEPHCAATSSHNVRASSYLSLQQQEEHVPRGAEGAAQAAPRRPQVDRVLLVAHAVGGGVGQAAAAGGRYRSAVRRTGSAGGGDCGQRWGPYHRSIQCATDAPSAPSCLPPSATPHLTMMKEPLAPPPSTRRRRSSGSTARWVKLSPPPKSLRHTTLPAACMQGRGRGGRGTVLHATANHPPRHHPHPPKSSL